MSGFVVGYGQPDQKVTEKMFSKIKHRGPNISGLHKYERSFMAQNYLKACKNCKTRCWKKQGKTKT